MKEQRRALGQQVLLTRVPKEWTLSLVRPGALRADASWQAILTTAAAPPDAGPDPQQGLDDEVRGLEPDVGDDPVGDGAGRCADARRQRYYRLVLPMEPDKLALSSHPLTWTTISHVIWDGLPPDTLSVSQQQAMLDWLHWGGQLIFTGGAGQSYPLYRESFLGPYLPGEATGETVALTEEDLQPLSQSYPPPRRRRCPRARIPSRCQQAHRDAAARADLPAAGADPAAPHQAGLSLGPAAGGRGRRPFRWARRARICWRSSGGSAAGGSRC